MTISGRQTDSHGEYRFHHQRIVMETAGVSAGDSEEVAILKIQRMWKRFEDRLICNNIQFNVMDGNVLKWAVSSKFDDFLFDAAIIWKVDLNKVDESDDRTVLDYVQSEIEKHKGSGIEGTLRSYYGLLESAGAKHKREL